MWWILHDYKNNFLADKFKESYNEAKHNINKENFEIEYESDETGLIKIKFKFNKFLTSTAFMFYDCESLESIDLSSFNSNNVSDMSSMFYGCYSLKSINYLHLILIMLLIWVKCLVIVNL